MIRRRLSIEKKTKRKQVTLLLFFCVLLWGISSFFSQNIKPEQWNENNKKSVALVDGGLNFSFVNVAEKTVREFLDARKLSLREGDSIFPDEASLLFSGTRIVIARAHEMRVVVDGGEQVLHTQAATIGQALGESTIAIDADDIVKPSRDMFAESGISVAITRVEIEESSVEKPIAFEKKVNEDENLSWRKNIVTQKGENGAQKLTYRVSRHDGKEINRKLLSTEIAKEPITQITTQGTLVKLGKSHTGGASWYAYTGTMAAANPWLPKGSYVKVTNLDNGKSVIVVINDRGPFVPSRIIDLDKVAFAKIASIGSGVITVKMEEIAN